LFYVTYLLSIESPYFYPIFICKTSSYERSLIRLYSYYMSRIYNCQYTFEWLFKCFISL